MSEDRRRLLFVLLGGALIATLIIHLSLVPRYVPSDLFSAGPVLLAGLVTYTITFYAFGRVRSDPQELPTMRFADIGIGLLLVSLLLVLALDAVGFTIEAATVVYVLPAIGIYAGLALIGWSIGRRTEAINEIVR